MDTVRVVEELLVGEIGGVKKFTLGHLMMIEVSFGQANAHLSYVILIEIFLEERPGKWCREGHSSYRVVDILEELRRKSVFGQGTVHECLFDEGLHVDLALDVWVVLGSLKHDYQVSKVEGLRLALEKVHRVLHSKSLSIAYDVMELMRESLDDAHHDLGVDPGESECLQEATHALLDVPISEVHLIQVRTHDQLYK